MTQILSAGDIVSRFRIVAPIGAGGMGQVYKAMDDSLERPVALKILPPEMLRSSERVSRFIQEAKSASSLSHPHIVHITRSANRRRPEMAKRTPTRSITSPWS
ncbi:MAG: protein kinase [Thermoanaerobaculia bacterium]